MHGECPADAEVEAVQSACWASRVVAGDAETLRSSFSARGAEGPRLKWCPDRADLQPEALQFLLKHWSTLRKDRPAPRTTDIDPLEMRPALGYILLLDIVEGGQDFRYRLFGSTIAAASGFDMTGRLMSAHPASRYILEFYFATYRAVLQRPEPLATVHSPPVAVSTTIWHRLILPLVDANDAVVRLLGGIVPVARDGKTITSGW